MPFNVCGVYAYLFSYGQQFIYLFIFFKNEISPFCSLGLCYQNECSKSVYDLLSIIFLLHIWLDHLICYCLGWHGLLHFSSCWFVLMLLLLRKMSRQSIHSCYMNRSCIKYYREEVMAFTTFLFSFSILCMFKYLSFWILCLLVCLVSWNFKCEMVWHWRRLQCSCDGFIGT